MDLGQMVVGGARPHPFSEPIGAKMNYILCIYLCTSFCQDQGMTDKEAEATMEDGTWIKRWRLDLRGACFTAIFVSLRRASVCFIGGRHDLEGCIGFTQHKLAFGCDVLMVPCTPLPS